MPQEKKNKQKVDKTIHDWKLFERKNMGSKCDEKTNPSIKHIKTFREHKCIEEWVQKNGDEKMVYLTEHWINNKRQGVESIEMGINRSWIDKWVYNDKRKWHRSAYTHSSETN